MSYMGNLTCRDCGLTFTARWGSVRGADEYRCASDHVVMVAADGGQVLSIDGCSVEQLSLVELRGDCPICSTELATGRLPHCPICSSRDHEVLLEGLG